MDGAGRSRRRDERTSGEGRAIRESDVGHIAGTTCEREILPKGKVGISLPHEDTAMVLETVELDAHHVVDLTLVPPCGGPDVGHRVGFVAFDELVFDTQMMSGTIPQGIQFVDYFPARLFAEMVDTADVDEIVKAEFVAAVFDDLFCPRLFGDDGLFAAEFDRIEDRSAEAVLEDGENGGHDVTSRSRDQTAFSFLKWATLEPSFEIFSCSRISPSSNASGRGGHPET